MNVKAPEIVVAALVLALTTAISAGYVNLPYAPLSSPWAVVALVVASLGAFMVSPVVGLSLFVLTAVLLFKRNVDRTAAATYGETSIVEAASATAAPFDTQSSQARQYGEFQETDASNPMLGPKIENFEPAAYGQEQGSPVIGQYPKEAPRQTTTGVSADFTYRPDANTGDNSFARFGPDLDDKKLNLAY